MQKTNLILQLIIEIHLTHCFSSLWAFLATLTEPHQTPRFKEYCIEIGMGFFTPRHGFCRKLEFEDY